jgi:hypothetical protein
MGNYPGRLAPRITRMESPKYKLQRGRNHAVDHYVDLVDLLDGYSQEHDVYIISMAG